MRARPSRREPVNSPSRITPENVGKIRPRPDRENTSVGASGGADGIRTARSFHLKPTIGLDFISPASVGGVAPGEFRACVGSSVGMVPVRNGWRFPWLPSDFQTPNWSSPARSQNERMDAFCQHRQI